MQLVLLDCYRRPTIFSQHPISSAPRPLPFIAGSDDSNSSFEGICQAETYICIFEVSDIPGSQIVVVN